MLTLTFVAEMYSVHTLAYRIQYFSEAIEDLLICEKLLFRNC